MLFLFQQMVPLHSILQLSKNKFPNLFELEVTTGLKPTPFALKTGIFVKISLIICTSKKPIQHVRNVNSKCEVNTEYKVKLKQITFYPGGR